jgi:hypothetical protein
MCMSKLPLLVKKIDEEGLRVSPMLAIETLLTLLAPPHLMTRTPLQMHVQTILAFEPLIAVITIIIFSSVCRTIFEMLVESVRTWKVPVAWETVIVFRTSFEVLVKGPLGEEVSITAVAGPDHCD